MTDDRHEEIAARLREEAAARAPERLRADVMLQVRAEPRPRRIRPRRTYWRPLGSLAAAACLVAAAAFGVTQFDSGTTGVSGAGATRSAGVAGALEGRTPAPSPTLGSRGVEAKPVPSTHKDAYGASSRQFDQEEIYAPFANAILHYTLEKRLTLAAPLRQAFAPLEPRQGRGTHTP